MSITTVLYAAPPAAGNDVTTGFAFNANVYVNTAVTVVLTLDSTGVDTLQVLGGGNDYTVAFAGDFSTATVNMIVPPPTGTTLHIFRNEPDTQIVDFVEGGDFPASSNEIGLDKLALQSQTQAGLLDLAPKFPSTVDSSAFDAEMPKPTALYYLRVNATNDGWDLVAVTTGTGNMSGPGDGVSTDNAVVRWDSTTGTVVQNGLVVIDDSGNITGVVDLTMTGDLAVTGTVDGRDVAADGTKLDFLTVTQSVDLDQMEIDVTANNAKVTNANHSGDVTGATALTIGNDKVLTAYILANNVTNAKLAQMPTLTMKGNDTGGALDPKDLTVAEVNTLLAQGTLTNIVRITSTIAYEKPADLAFAIVRTTAPGGGAGGRNVSNTGSGGGGAGASSVILLLDSAIASSETATIGADGVGGIGENDGGTGGTTSFGAHTSCLGGVGGHANGAGGVGAAEPSLGDELYAGGGGMTGSGDSVATSNSGTGGASIYGSGGRGHIGGSNNDGDDGRAPGSGGGGATGLAVDGGDGGPGLIIIEEYTI